MQTVKPLERSRNYWFITSKFNKIWR